jgi:hypothetical protein
MKKIFIIILLISVVFILSFLDLNAVFKNEFRYNNKMFVQMSIIITCLVFIFKLVLEIIDPNIFNTLKRAKSIKDDKKNKSVYSLKNQNVASSKELDSQYNIYKKVSKNHQNRKEEIKRKEALELKNKARVKKIELEQYLKNKEKKKQKLKEEELEINRLIALEEKERKKPNIKKSVTSKTTAKKEVVKVTKSLKTKAVVPKIKAEKSITKKTTEKRKSESINSNTTKRVNYSTDRIITSTAQYPVIRKPQQKSVIRSFRLGRNNRKGYKEEAFYDAIRTHFYNDFNVLDNAMLAIGEGTNPYEPDIAMVSKGKQNIFIDIEIDEPYAGVSRKLTHCYPEGINRDNYFVDRGWFVIRFSEYQVHHQIEECLHEIAKVITTIDVNLRNEKLSHYMFIDEEDCWDEAQAQRWENINYRENYLNHTFKPYNEPKRIIDTALTLEEKLEERLVKPQTHIPIKKPTKKNSTPKVNNYIEKAKPVVPPPKKEFNSNNSKVSDLIEMAISKGYTIEMKYTNYNGESSIRKISKLESTQEFLEFGYGNTEHFKGYCHNRESERSFKVSRVNYMKVLN